MYISGINKQDGWCILRTAGRHTLPLATSLGHDGYEVWTPARSTRIRRSRWNMARDVTMPLLAGFVFAKAHHLVDLLELASMAERPRRGSLPAHPGFSVFHHLDRIPIVADTELAALREQADAAPTPDELSAIFRPGESVKVAQGIFGGMAGIVERVDGTHTLVRFGSRMRVKISTFILEPKNSCNKQPTSAISHAQVAKAA